LQEIVSYINENASFSIVKSNLGFKKLKTRTNEISQSYTDKITTRTSNVLNLKFDEFLSKCNDQIETANHIKLITDINHRHFNDYNKFELNIEIDNDNPDDDDQTASNEQLQQYNVDLFNLINSNLISNPAIPADEPKIVNLRLSEYYIFIITLFFFDVCHDYFNKSRHKDPTINDSFFINKTTQILSTNLKLIADEWTHYYSMLNIGVDNREQNNPESFLKICRDFGLTPSDTIHMATEDGKVRGLSPLLQYLECTK
jgi:hypothetical protein